MPGYLDWNNAIVRHIFLSGQKETVLAMSMHELVQLGRTILGLENSTDEEIEQNCRFHLTNGLPGSGATLVEKATHALNCWSKGNVEVPGRSIPLTLPPYAGLLLATVLPIVEDDPDNELHGGNYYDRLNGYWRWMGNRAILTLKGLEPAWNDLAEWSASEERAQLIIAEGGQYVGRPLSQCPLRPRHLRQLPRLFERAELYPKGSYESGYSDEELLDAFKAHAQNTLTLLPARINALVDEGIYRSTLLSILRSRLDEWDGGVQEEGGREVAIQETCAFLGLLVPQFRDDLEQLSFSYRVRLGQDPPEGLALIQDERNLPVIRYREDWSKQIELPFSINHQLNGTDPRWKFRTRTAPDGLFLFVRGGQVGLANEYWVRVDKLERYYGETRILCPTNKTNDFWKWHGQGATVEHLERLGVPDGFQLYKVSTVTASHPDPTFTTVQLPSEATRTIQLIGGVRLQGRENIRTYIKEYPPHIMLLNGENGDRLELHYEMGGAQGIGLEARAEELNTWSLPDDIADIPFRFRVFDAIGAEVAQTPNHRAVSLRECQGQQWVGWDPATPKRDQSGRLTENHENFMQGCSVNLSPDRQLHYHQPYQSAFYPRDRGAANELVNEVPEYPVSPANTFLSWLSYHREGTFKAFTEAYNAFYGELYRDEDEANLQNGPMAGVAKNYFEHLGHLELLEDERGNIRYRMNAPRLIPIPAITGRRVLLTGARCMAMVDDLFKNAIANRVRPVVIHQAEQNKHLLLPDAIILESKGLDAEDRLRKTAEAAGIPLVLGHTIPPVQVGLFLLASSLVEYEQQLATVDGEEFLNSRFIYDMGQLDWRKNNAPETAKGNLLAEYQFDYYQRTYWWWRTATERFTVERNWGIYLALQQAGRTTLILRRNLDAGNADILVPIRMPLPRMLNRALILLTGLVPSIEKLDGRLFRVYNNAPGTFVHNLFLKLGQQAQDINA